MKHRGKVYMLCARQWERGDCDASCATCHGASFVLVSERAVRRRSDRIKRRLRFLWNSGRHYVEPARPPLGQRARRAVASIPAGYVAEYLVMGSPFALLWHAGHAVGMTEDGAQRLLAGGSTARRRHRLAVLKAVQREVSNG